MLDEKTIYYYIDQGLLSIGNIDLARKVRYRPRKKQRSLKLDRHCCVNRTYVNLKAFLLEHPDLPVVEMDSVVGEDGGKYCLPSTFATQGCC